MLLTGDELPKRLGDGDVTSDETGLVFFESGPIELPNAVTVRGFGDDDLVDDGSPERITFEPGTQLCTAFVHAQRTTRGQLVFDVLLPSPPLGVAYKDNELRRSDLFEHGDVDYAGYSDATGDMGSGDSVRLIRDDSDFSGRKVRVTATFESSMSPDGARIFYAC